MLSKVIASLEKLAPLKFAEKWDNVGLLIETPIPRASAIAVFLTIDLTTSVLEEAMANPDVGVVVSYHPPLFASLKRLCMDDPKSAIALRCAAAGLSVYSPHTSLDNCANGINDWLAQSLGPGVTNPISPLNPLLLGVPGQENAGIGRIHNLHSATKLSIIIARLKQYLNLDHIRVAGDPKMLVTKIAICAGSGSSVLMPVNDAHLYLTGEMGHHDLLAAREKQIAVILCEHSNSERGYLNAVLKPHLEQDCKEISRVIVSDIDRDPISIY